MNEIQNCKLQIISKCTIKIIKKTNYLRPFINYVIKFESGHQQYGQKGWYVAINGDKNNSMGKRTVNTRWAYLHKPSHEIHKQSVKWRFIPILESQNTYKIIVGDKQFENYELFCYQDMSQDKRDNNPSYFVFIAPQNYYDRFNKWKVEKITDNLYTIKNVDNNVYLSSHRNYQSDHRSSESTWLMGHSKRQFFVLWNISPF